LAVRIMSIRFKATNKKLEEVDGKNWDVFWFWRLQLKFQDCLNGVICLFCESRVLWPPSGSTVIFCVFLIFMLYLKLKWLCWAMHELILLHSTDAILSIFFIAHYITMLLLFEFVEICHWQQNSVEKDVIGKSHI
jgi:hypothetical protein